MTATIAYFRDFGGQVVSTGIPCKAASTTVERQAVLDALQSWSVGASDGGDETIELEPRVGSGSPLPSAHSGYYAFMVMKDSVNGRSYRERVPMPDLQKVVDGNGDTAWVSENDSSGNSINVANPFHSDYTALKTAMEAAYVSPNGNAATLTKVYIPNKL